MCSCHGCHDRARTQRHHRHPRRDARWGDPPDRGGWRRAVGSLRLETPVPAARSKSYGDHKLDWLSEYRGGWQLLVPNAGVACVVDGVPLPFHGEWSRTRVDVRVLQPHRVQFRSGVRLPLVVERVVEVHDDPRRISLTINDGDHERRRRSPRVRLGRAPCVRIRARRPDRSAGGPDRQPDRSTERDHHSRDRRRRGPPPRRAVSTCRSCPAAPPLEDVLVLPDRPAACSVLPARECLDLRCQLSM